MTRSLRYSDAAIRVLADFNGVHPDQQAHWTPFAVNEEAHRWMEALGARFAAGLPVYRAPGQFYQAHEIEVLERQESRRAANG